MNVIKYLDIKGSCVINEEGEIKGSVEDCIFNNSSKRIHSAIVIKKSPLIHSCVIKLSDIKHFGDNLIVKGKLYPMERGAIVKNSSRMFNRYINKVIVDSNGDEIGEMKDAIIEEQTGLVKAIICSRGFVDDMLEGRRVVLVNQDTIFGQDKIIISNSSIDIYNDMSIWKLTRG